MNILGIETTTSLNSIAITSEDKVLAEYSFSSGDRLSKMLLPAINDILKKSNLPIRDIEGIGVTRGPGFFTGVRMGLSVAKGLALGLDIPVAGISTLEALAHNVFSNCSGLICPMLLSRKGEIYTAVYEPNSRGKLKKVKEESCCLLPKLLEEVNSPTIFLGEGALKYKPEIKKIKGKLADFPSSSLNHLSATKVAFLAREKIREGVSSDDSDLTPVYLRKPQIGRDRG